MASVFNEIKEFSFGGSSGANIDNHVFRAYYVFTSGFLVAAAGLLVTSQFFGDPIDCIADAHYNRADSSKKSIDNFCWVGATYTVPELYGDETKIGVSKVDDGVGQFNPTLNHTQRFQMYYRWIFILLIINAVNLYIPHYFWKNWESNKMEFLSTMLNNPIETTLDVDRRRTRIELLLDYLQEFEINSHNYYTYKFYVCEASNLGFLVVNICILNFMTDNLFVSIGLDFLQNGFYYSPVLTKLFPIHAKCLWRTVGPSGSIQENDALCLLSLNSFNKVFFGVLWFWYMILGVITIFWLVFRMTTIFLVVRSKLLRWKACPVNFVNHKHPTGTDCIDCITKLLPHEDWFVILQLVDNTDSVAIKSILGGLCERLMHLQRRRSTNPQISVMNNKTSLSK